LHYLQKTSDAGFYSNACELGNIFDPIRWGDVNNPFHPLDPAAWMVLGRGGNVSTTGAACGRNSLRIGRFEHPRFDTNGARSAQLLDLFAAGPTNSPVVTNTVAGKININTASTNVLRALAAGVVQSVDPALQPGGTNFVVPTNAIRAFVRGVTNFRATAPFFSPSQLASITTNGIRSEWPTNAVFGNFGSGAINSANYFGNQSVGSVTGWNDEAAEEWFSKVYPLASVRSRNFLVVVVGESLQSGTLQTSSTARRAYQVFVQPLRATNGTALTTNASPLVLQTWDL
jgi:hypothetical protein